MIDSVESELIAWGESQDDVRALILTSTRAQPGANTDAYSDYDIIVFTDNVGDRYHHRDWLSTFGEVVISWWDPLETAPGTEVLTTGNIVYYPGTRKIDFTLWPVAMSALIAENLPAELDAGYRVLLDKDGLTDRWPSSTYQAYLTRLPDAEAYLDLINSFFIGVPYVETALVRGELLPAKWVLDYDMRYEYLLPMLEWYAVAVQGEPVRIGNHGKGLQKLLPASIWARLEQTYSGMNIAENRAALHAMVRLFRDVAIDVGAAIGVGYDEELHERVMKHVRNLEAI